MNQNLFNDTLDNFSFSTSARVTKPTDTGNRKNTISSQDFNIIDENAGKSIGTISFDDTAFFSESFSISEEKRESLTRRSNEDLFNGSENGSDIFSGFEDISNFSHAVINNEDGQSKEVDKNVSGCDIFDNSQDINNGINNYTYNVQDNHLIEGKSQVNGSRKNVDEVKTLNSSIGSYLFESIDEFSNFTLNSDVKKDKTFGDVCKELDNNPGDISIKNESIIELQRVNKLINIEIDSNKKEDIIKENEPNTLENKSVKIDMIDTAYEESIPTNKQTLQNLVDVNVLENKEEKDTHQNKDIKLLQESSRQTVLSCDLVDWNLPEMILQKYQKHNVKSMFDWQTECLSNENILYKNKNLVYSAPTSAGKTLVAEILGIKTLIERNKKVIFVLPFVSVVREKMFHFQDLLGTSGIRVEGFMGSYQPPGGFKTVQLAICTIEKANSLINRLLEDGELNDIGAVIIDEMHLLGDESRGYLLELLLTKLKYMSKRDEELQIQIIGMSATLPNLDVLANWLDAELYTTTFRPIPLHELCHVNGEVYDNQLKLIRKLPVIPELQTDTDNVLQLCLETIKNSCSVLIFCPTKNWCENLSQQMSAAIRQIGNSKTELGDCLRKELKAELIIELMEQLKRCPVGLDVVLKKTVSFAVAFHHAGLTMDERDIIEGGFRSGAIRILVATSTLSSGVNLPARRVIVRTPTFYGKPIDTLTYRQMIGRAGRMGKDIAGESLLICQKKDYNTVRQLMSAKLDPVESCLQSGKLKRAILEVVTSGVASTPEDVQLFADCTLLANENSLAKESNLTHKSNLTNKSNGTKEKNNLENPIEESIKFLERNQFIRLQKQEDGTLKYVATSLAKACLSSSLPPEEGLTLFTELEKARQCFVLETELHLIYLVTPYNTCNAWGNIDWMFFLNLWEKLPKSMKRVGELVGIKESFMANASCYTMSKSRQTKSYQALLIHKRFYTALALQDLVNEIPLNQVAAKFSCSRGLLQSLQQSASTFAGMVTAFSKQLGWTSVELLISQFQDRLHFGINRDLLDLMRLPIMNGPRARTLYNAGFQTLVQLAAASAEIIENVLHKVMPFESENQRDGESKYDADKRNKIRTVWVTGKQGLTEREAARMLIDDARRYLQLEMGLADAKWISQRSAGDDTDLGINSEQENENTKSSSSRFSSKEIERIPKVSEKLPDNNDAIKHNLEQNTTGNTSKVRVPEPKEHNKLQNDHNLVLRVTLSSHEFNRTEQRVDTKQQDLNLKSKLGNASKIPKLTNNHQTQTSNLDGTKDRTELKNKESPLKKHNILYKPERTGHETLKTYNIAPKTNVNNISDAKVPINNQRIEKVIGNVTNCKAVTNFKDIEIQRQQADSGIETQTPKNQEKHLNFSDTSLFESSFNTPDVLASDLNEAIVEVDLSKDNDSELKLSLNNSDFATNVSFKNVSSSSPGNTSSEFIASSQKNNILSIDSPIKLLELNSPLRKRKLSERNSTTECITETPTKKKKIVKKTKKTKRTIDPSFIITQDKTVYLDRSATEMPRINNNSKNLDIVNVCDDEKVFDSFRAEIQTKKEISVAIGCVEVQLQKPKIGMKLLKSDVSDKKEFSHGNKQVDGISLSWGDNTSYYVSFNSSKVTNVSKIDLLKKVLSNQSLKVRMFDSKEHIRMLALCLGVEFCGEIEDPTVGDWLLDPDGKEKNLQAMVMQHCPEVGKISQLAGISMGVGSVSLDVRNMITPRIRSSVEAVITWHLVNSVVNTIAELEMKLLHAYYIEMSTIRILARMELYGFGVNVSCLEKLSNELMQKCFALERKAFEIAGRKFSFSSSTDVAKVVGMYRGKRVSTSKQVLENNDHPIAGLIVQWRKINHILTNTIYPLLRIVKNDRIYSCCITRNSTGRISMQEPNLQNVPRNFEALNPSDNTSLTINCREAFQSKDRYVFLSADYSQLELRLLAHLSKDKLLISILNSDGDVFKSIAAKLNRIPENMVNDDLRQKAKQICYGIIYGMGVKALAEQMQTVEEEAVVFIDNFHRTYPAIKKYIHDVIEGCKSNGYVVTIAGRRRFLPNISHQHPAVKSQAERQAVNTTIQGSAADIAKNAMVLIDNNLKQKFKESKHMPQLVLQLHDELMYEVLEKYVTTTAKIVKNCMENSVRLSVPFPVKIKWGKTWGTLQENDV